MMRLLHLLLPVAALTVFGGLGGCAAPQYQTNVSLIPPGDESGRACVQICESRRITCEAGCQDRFRSCAKAIEPQVEAGYGEALAQFENDLRQYAAALRAYETQLSFAWFNSYPYGWGTWGWPWMGPWPGMYFPPPYPVPKMPTRADVRAQLEKSSCQADCGCQPVYEGCFVGCGGQRLSETVCIKNCPPAQ
jgi:hypothetical protein